MSGPNKGIPSDATGLAQRSTAKIERTGDAFTVSHLTIELSRAEGVGLDELLDLTLSPEGRPRNYRGVPGPENVSQHDLAAGREPRRGWSEPRKSVAEVAEARPGGRRRRT